MRQFNILILHALGDFSSQRKTLLNHALSYTKYAPHHNYFYHDYRQPVTDAMRKIRFHAVILDTSFLALRYLRPIELFYEYQQKYSFIRDSDTVRIAFPQDEYDNCQLLDEWLIHYKVDIAFSVCWDHRDVLYPLTAKAGEIRECLTGYVDDRDVSDMKSKWEALQNRRIDVSYRARNLPPEFGCYGRQKAIIGEKFKEALASHDLNIDISTNPKDVFVGDDWLRFLLDSRFVLGSQGGSSLCDPRGEIRDRIRAFLRKNPDAAFEDIEAACFPGLDGQYIFSAISPRLFEYAAAGCAQVLIRAPYLGTLTPGEHYICVEPDFSNLEDVIAQLFDLDAASRMAEAAYETLIASNRYHYSRFIADVMQHIERKLEEKRTAASTSSEFEELKTYHLTELGISEQAKKYQTLARSIPMPLRRLLPSALKPLVRRLIAGRAGKAITNGRQ